MLQLNSQAGPQAVSGRPAGFAQPAVPTPVVLGDDRTMPAGESASFAELQVQLQMQALEQAGHGGDVALAELPSLEQEVARDMAGVVLPGPDAEQWLRSMLAQHAVRIEARDGGEGEVPGERLEPLAAIGRTAAERQRNVQDPRPAQAEAGAQGEARWPGATGMAERLPGQGPSLTLGQGLPSVADPAAPLRSAGPVASEALLAASVGTGPEPLAGQTLAHLERLPGEASVSSAATGAGGGEPGQAAQTPLLERRLELQAPQAKWGEQMLHALRESVEVQVQQRVQHATIRLDPPELGSLEIFLSHESGRLSVQITAAQSDVARLLQHTSERLRQELVGQNLMQVSVQVSADGQSGQQHAQQGRTRLFDEEPVLAGAPQAEPPAGAASRPDDVLITV